MVEACDKREEDPGRGLIIGGGRGVRYLTAAVKMLGHSRQLLRGFGDNLSIAVDTGAESIVP